MVNNLISINSTIDYELCRQAYLYAESIIEVSTDDVEGWAISMDEWTSCEQINTNTHPKIEMPDWLFQKKNERLTLEKKIKQTPILLVNSLNYNCVYTDDDNLLDIKYPPTEFFGVYTICPYKYIVICPEKIQDFCDKHNFDFKLIFSKVLIHEIVHAALDTIGKYTEFKIYNWMEESLANYVTLKLYEMRQENKTQEAINNYKNVTRFVDGQPPAYRLALLINHINTNIIGNTYINWRNKKIDEGSSITNEWLNCAKNLANCDYYNPDIKVLDKIQKLEKAYLKLIENKIY